MVYFSLNNDIMFYHSNPNNVTDEHLSLMNWSAFNETDAYYLDIGRHLVEKRGLYLNRYARWNVSESSENNSARRLQFSLLTFITIIVFTVLKNN